jgi:hypothetical protein
MVSRKAPEAHLLAVLESFMGFAMRRSNAPAIIIGHCSQARHNLKGEFVASRVVAGQYCLAQ